MRGTISAPLLVRQTRRNTEPLRRAELGEKSRECCYAAPQLYSVPFAELADRIVPEMGDVARRCKCKNGNPFPKFGTI
jgi:hypothetical protein